MTKEEIKRNEEIEKRFKFDLEILYDSNIVRFNEPCIIRSKIKKILKNIGYRCCTFEVNVDTTFAFIQIAKKEKTYYEGIDYQLCKVNALPDYIRWYKL